jgi:Tfp pilus assembly protein PilZ
MVMSELPPTASSSSPKPVSDRALPAAITHQERRQHPRFKVEGASVILGKGGLLASLGLPQKKDLVTNLSRGGVLVKARKRHAVGARLQLEIRIPSPADTVSCKSIVRWCAQSAKDDAQFFTGIQFENLDSPTEKKLAQMEEWFTSAAFRASAARKEASSAQLKKPKYD